MLNDNISVIRHFFLTLMIWRKKYFVLLSHTDKWTSIIIFGQHSMENNLSELVFRYVNRYTFHHEMIGIGRTPISYSGPFVDRNIPVASDARCIRERDSFVAAMNHDYRRVPLCQPSATGML